MDTVPTSVRRPGDGRGTLWAVAAVLIILVALFVYHASRYWFLIDDAFISFRYARNLAEGGGLVFNPGEEPVEGYSNLAWVLLMALAVRAGILPEVASRLLGVASGAVMLLATWRLARRAVDTSRGARWLALVPVAILVANRSVAAWSTGGLETRLFSALLVAAVWLAAWDLDRDHRRFPTALPLLALVVLTRVDGFLHAGTVVATVWLYRRFRPRPADWLLALGVGSTVLAQLAFRLVYYGEWVPNTFRVKVVGFQAAAGLHYAGLAALHYGLGIAVALAALAWARGRGRPAVGLASTVLLAHLLYTVSVGGDHFEFRFLDPIWSFAAVLAVAGAAETGRLRWRPRRAVAATLLAVLGLWNTFPALVGFPATDRIVSVELEAAMCDAWGDVGRWFARHAAPDEVIAVRPAGVIPYRSRLRTLDMLGLNDKVVARGEPTSGEVTAGHRKIASWEDILVRGGADYYIGHPDIRLDPRLWTSWSPQVVEVGKHRFALIPVLVETERFWFRFDVVSEEAVLPDGSVDADRATTKIRPLPRPG